MKRTPLKRGKPLKKVGKKRAKANAEYSKRRKAFLEAHPFCQWWIRENMATNIAAYGFQATEQLVIRSSGIVRNAFGEILKCPPAQDIHHMRKPRATYLNDESTWMAVSREGHNWIEDHKSEARKRGYLE